MENEKVIVKSENEVSMITRVSKFINKYHVVITLGLMAVLVLSFICFGDDKSSEAAAGTSADTLWTTITDLVKTWVTRLGGVVMFVGGVMFGLGWKNDDAEGKSRGVSTIIAGAIVIAVAQLASTFFA